MLKRLIPARGSGPVHAGYANSSIAFDDRPNGSYWPKAAALKSPFALPDPEQPSLRPMQALETRFGDEHELADLHSGFLIGRDHVRLHDAGHSRLQRHLRKRSRRAAFRSEHGREVAAAESVHEVIVYGEARVLDN